MGSPELLTGVPRALTIAGSDSGGGAGIQADLKTFLALGVHGMSAIVALTAQNTTGVSAVHPVPPAFVKEQILQVVVDIGVDAAKTGMLADADIVSAVAESVEALSISNLVVDPVFISKSGDRLLSEAALDALITRLIPLATVVTPNLFEAGSLTGSQVSTLEQMKEAATAIHAMGPRFVLVKGGHLGGDAIDLLYDGTDFVEMAVERIDSKHTHGTGCTLSAAITAELAKGKDVVKAVTEAKRFVTGAIAHGLVLGQGYGPTNHGWESTLKGK